MLQLGVDGVQQFADLDGDGQIDGDEYRAGTLLLDPNSVYRIDQLKGLPNGSLEISWRSVIGKRYQLEVSDSISNPEWTRVGDVIPASVDSDKTEIAVTIDAAARSRFFRVILIEE